MATNNTPRGWNQERLSPLPDRNEPATVALLAERFGLSPDELRAHGLHDLPGRKGVGIPYRDVDGTELFVRLRQAVFATNKTRQPADTRPAPYGLWRLNLAREARCLWIVEGESDCWTAWRHGLPFVGLPGWSNFACLTLPHVHGIPEIYIVREPDEGGDALLAKLPPHLRNIGYHGRLWEVRMPEGIKDPAQLFCHAPALFPKLLAGQVEKARELLPLPPAPPTPASSNGQASADEPTPAADPAGKDGAPPAAQLLVELVLAAGVELFHDNSGRAYAWCGAKGTRHALLIRSRQFTHLLHRIWKESEGRPLPRGTRETVVDELDARACYEGPELAVHVRRAVDSGLTYRDLGGLSSAAVRIGPDGWQIVEDPPVPFLRPAGMLPLPTPDPAGRLDELRFFLNLADDGQWRLLVGWTLVVARGVGPFPILAITGQADSGKSLSAWFLKDLLDPAVATLRAEPKRTTDVFIGAGQCELLVYENLSRMEAALSDALCVVSTGGVDAGRTLYSNDEESTRRAENPIVITAIEEVATRGDFLSRAVLLDLPPLASDKRHSKEDLLAEWQTSRPRVLGGLFTTLAGALAEVPTVDYDRDCRMPHLAQLGAAAGRVLGWPEGAFTAALIANRQEAAETALEAQPVVEVVTRLLDNRPLGCWVGTAAELLAELLKIATADEAGSRGWPKQPHHLSGRLKRLARDLRTRGIVYERQQTNGAGSRKLIHLTSSPGAPAGHGSGPG